MHPQNIRAAGVIQLLGGVGPNGNVQATILTQQLAAHLGCPAAVAVRRVLSTRGGAQPSGKQPGRRGGGGEICRSGCGHRRYW